MGVNQNTGVQYAWLMYQNQIYYSRCHPESFEPHSALSTLVQGIYQNHSQWARKILRTRIYSSDLDPVFDLGIVKVAAKRAKLADKNLVLENLNLEKIEVFFERNFEPLNSPIGDLRLDKGPKHKEVSAKLYMPNGQIILTAQSLAHINPTFHAEFLLAQKWWQKMKSPFPQGARIHVSLKPCKMCAGAILRMLPVSHDLNVIYLQFDPGPMAQNTGLESFERCDWTLNI